SNQSCLAQQSSAQQVVYPLLLLAQLLLGVASVPIQPFGISYIDDHASRRNSPLYLGILLAVTSIGPAFGFVTGAFMLRFYVDFDKLTKGEEIKLDSKDLRWVGAWWVGFLMAACLLFITALPYFFFPRNMPKEVSPDGQRKLQTTQSPNRTASSRRSPSRSSPCFSSSKVSLTFPLPVGFPRIALRTLRSPIYLLVVLAQVNLAALLSGLATFMAKFIERQFSQTVSFSTMMIGAVGIPMAVLGTVLGGALMRRFNLSVSGSSKLCTAAILLCMFSAMPLLLIGCPTQTVAGGTSFTPDTELTELSCSSGCRCPQEAFNPVCGSDGVEFRSPCHAGCLSVETDADNKVTNYTDCRCVGGLAVALPGTCGSGCSHLLRPFMVLLALTSFIAAFSQTPSYMMILRYEDKNRFCKRPHVSVKISSYSEQVLSHFGDFETAGCVVVLCCCRFLGLQVVFVCGALLCFLLTVVVLRRRRAELQELQPDNKGGYELVNEHKAADGSKEENGTKT
uniref:Solute carrier organic anion transporter family member n=1 Tax=Stegastes partitus TaxID=144197 RepID=A0A3B4Z7M8_9TELE